MYLELMKAFNLPTGAYHITTKEKENG